MYVSQNRCFLGFSLDLVFMSVLFYSVFFIIIIIVVVYLFVLFSWTPVCILMQKRKGTDLGRL